jgi:hypothetical protein
MGAAVAGYNGNDVVDVEAGTGGFFRKIVGTRRDCKW